MRPAIAAAKNLPRGVQTIVVGVEALQLAEAGHRAPKEAGAGAAVAIVGTRALVVLNVAPAQGSRGFTILAPLWTKICQWKARRLYLGH